MAVRKLRQHRRALEMRLALHARGFDLNGGMAFELGCHASLDSREQFLELRGVLEYRAPTHRFSPDVRRAKPPRSREHVSHICEQREAAGNQSSHNLDDRVQRDEGKGDRQLTHCCRLALL